MAITFKDVRKLQGKRVRMQFDDGREVVAQLLCATKDMDGSKHLIYDNVESVSSAPISDAPISGTETAGCFYADAKSLVGIDSVDARKTGRLLRGWDILGVRQEVAEAEDWRPGT